MSSPKRVSRIGALGLDGIWVEGADAPLLINWDQAPWTAAMLFAGMSSHKITSLHVHWRALEYLELPDALPERGSGGRRPPHPFVCDSVFNGQRVSQRALAPSIECDGLEIMIGAYQDTGDPFAAARDARELRDAHVAFTEAFEVGSGKRWVYRNSANTTGWRLMHGAWSHGRRKAQLPDLYENPQPKLDGIPDGAQVEQVYGGKWARKRYEGVEEHEYEWMLRNVLAWDVNGQRLAACAGLPCGVGGLTEIVRDEGAQQWKAPGYHLVTKIEHPFEGLIPHLMEPGWHTTPMLSMAAYLKIPFEAKRSWIWTEHVPYLTPYYEKMRDARRLLQQGIIHGTPGARIALQALKDCYLQPLGRLRSQKTLASEPQYYRPHWYDSVIGQEVAREYYRLHQLAQMRMPVLAVYFDTIIIESDSQDLFDGAPAPIEVSNQLGKYKPVGHLDTPTARRLLYPSPAIEQKHPETRGRAHDVGALIRALKAAGNG